MRLKEIVLQGLTPRTHSDVILGILQATAIERLILAVAFVTEGGVAEIADTLKPLADVTVVYAGIRNGVTTRQGLERLVEIGIEVNTVDTGVLTPIYHPKLVYARSTSNVAIVAGSCNLTLGGLHNNIEGSLLVEVDAADASEMEECAKLESIFDGLHGLHPHNVRSVKDGTVLAEMFSAGLLVDEESGAPVRAAALAKNQGQDSTPRMKMALPPKRRSRARPKNLGVMTIVEGTRPADVRAAADYVVVWESGPLQRRDIGLPTGETTNSTGSINLDKGAFGKSIDQRHYFRDEVFVALNWPPVSGQVDKATATFELVVKGVHRGTHTMTVRHTTSITSPTYAQDNAMTRLSWGKAARYVRNEQLLDGVMTLSRDRNDPTRFMIDLA